MQLEEKETATVVLRSFRLLGRRVYVGATAAHTTPVHLRVRCRPNSFTYRGT